MFNMLKFISRTLLKINVKFKVHFMFFLLFMSDEFFECSEKLQGFDRFLTLTSFKLCMCSFKIR